jgi:hypothetical protein
VVNDQVRSDSPKLNRVSCKILAPVTDTRHPRNLLERIEQPGNPAVGGL